MLVYKANDTCAQKFTIYFLYIHTYVTLNTSEFIKKKNCMGCSAGFYSSSTVLLLLLLPQVDPVYICSSAVFVLGWVGQRACSFEGEQWIGTFAFAHFIQYQIFIRIIQQELVGLAHTTQRNYVKQHLLVCATVVIKQYYVDVSR